MPELARRLAQAGERQFGADVHIGHAPVHRQHDMACLRNRLRQLDIVLRVLQVGFAEQHVHAQGLGVLGGDAIYQLRMHGAAPRPAAHALQARIVNRNDDDVIAGHRRAEPAGDVLHKGIDDTGLLAQAGPGHQAQQQRRQRQPLQPAQLGPAQ